MTFKYRSKMLERSISGFSKLSKSEKIAWLANNYLPDAPQVQELLGQFCQNEDLQGTIDGFSENTLSNFVLPYSIAPNFRINDRIYAVPMVTEESSVVAAASSAAKYWLERGGFRVEVRDMVKVGQLHFRWGGQPERREELLPRLREALIADARELTSRMESRGGGVLDLQWLHLPAVGPDCYQLLVEFDTQDSMGANFINSVLEQYGISLETWCATAEGLEPAERQVDVIMAILSNYTPRCVAVASVSARLPDMAVPGAGMDPDTFSRRFEMAVRIARQDPYRAVTHNKGIMNGIDAVILATANDFRAIEADAHAYAARDGQYRSLSTCTVEGDRFHFELEIPLALGTVGGLTKLHPLAKLSLELLGNPNARELMEIVAATGLAQNFAAVRSLVTVGIQRGHMKMHLQNILAHLDAAPNDRVAAEQYFAERTVSHHAVREFLAGRQ
jgi:hydroxymethylglutaryl-CoA reductase